MTDEAAKRAEKLMKLCDTASATLVKALMPLIHAAMEEAARVERERIMAMIDDWCHATCADHLNEHGEFHGATGRKLNGNALTPLTLLFWLKQKLAGEK